MRHQGRCIYDMYTVLAEGEWVANNYELVSVLVSLPVIFTQARRPPSSPGLAVLTRDDSTVQYVLPCICNIQLEEQKHHPTSHATTNPQSSHVKASPHHQSHHITLRAFLPTVPNARFVLRHFLVSSIEFYRPDSAASDTLQSLALRLTISAARQARTPYHPSFLSETVAQPDAQPWLLYCTTSSLAILPVFDAPCHTEINLKRSWPRKKCSVSCVFSSG
jgi:hypothetical protein